MATAVVQEDFGGFNPRFPGGVGVTLGSPQAYEVFIRYLQDEGASTSDSLTEIALKSVIEHEVRHFHDALLSPWGSMLLRLRGQAVVNGLQAIRVGREIDGDLVPLPIPRWLALGDEQRDARLEEWAEDLGVRLTPIGLPAALDTKGLAQFAGGVVDVSALSEADQLVAYASAAVGAYDVIRMLVAGDPPPGAPPELRPAMVFEVSALAGQLQAIVQSQGLAEGVRFADFLLNSERPYAALWRTFLQLGLVLASDRRPGSERASLLFEAQDDVVRMALWTLLGNHQLDGLTAACPTQRFLGLAARLLEQHADPAMHEDDAGRAWDAWDAAIGVRPWREGIEENLAAGQRAAAQYDRLTEVWQGDPEVPATVGGVVGRRVADQERAARLLLDDPNALTHGDTYLNRDHEALPSPALRVELEGFAVPPPEPRPANYRAVRTVDGAPDGPVMSFAFGLGDLEGEALDDLLSFETFACACDLAFSEHTMPSPDFARSRSTVESVTRKQVLLVV